MLDAGARKGMKQSAEHAEQERPGWGAEALTMLTRYVREIGGEFTAPMAREWAIAQGLPEPASRFAWGSVFNRAARRGLIQRAGFTQFPGDDTAHTRAVTLWKVAA